MKRLVLSIFMFSIMLNSCKSNKKDNKDNQVETIVDNKSNEQAEEGKTPDEVDQSETHTETQNSDEPQNSDRSSSNSQELERRSIPLKTIEFKDASYIVSEATLTVTSDSEFYKEKALVLCSAGGKEVKLLSKFTSSLAGASLESLEQNCIESYFFEGASGAYDDPSTRSQIANRVICDTQYRPPYYLSIGDSKNGPSAEVCDATYLYLKALGYFWPEVVNEIISNPRIWCTTTPQSKQVPDFPKSVKDSLTNYYLNIKQARAEGRLSRYKITQNEQVMSTTCSIYVSLVDN